MKTTKTLIVALTAVLSLGMICTSVWAGSKQQHRWEGIAIGVGAAIVGSALINHHAYGYPSGPPVVFSFNYRENHRHPSRHRGYRIPHRGGHDNRWRAHDRGPHCSGHGRLHGHRHHGNWQSHDRRHPDARGRHHRGHGARRY